MSCAVILERLYSQTQAHSFSDTGTVWHTEEKKKKILTSNLNGRCNMGHE